MSSTTLAGPLRAVYYANGVVEYHDLPRDTLDVRYEACGDHHLACWCREAQHAEDVGEYRVMYDNLREAVEEAIKGHPTWSYTRAGEVDEGGQCKCTACGIARATMTGYSAWARADHGERVPF